MIIMMIFIIINVNMTATSNVKINNNSSSNSINNFISRPIWISNNSCSSTRWKLIF